MRATLLNASELAISALGALVAVALIVFVMAGGMFYRTSCPSKVTWSFNPVPFVHVVDADETACSVDTATGYYTGKVPVVGAPLRALVKSVTGQADGASG